jgi:hypothetical protein
MSAPYHDIESKLEEAFVAVLAAQLTDEQLDDAEIYTGLSAEDIESGKRIVCECTNASGVPGQAGNWSATVQTVIRTPADPRPRAEKLAEHRSLVAYVRDVLMDTTLPTLLEAEATDVQVMGILTDPQIQQGRELPDEEGETAEHFVATITQTVRCNTLAS